MSLNVFRGERFRDEFKSLWSNTLAESTIITIDFFADLTSAKLTDFLFLAKLHVKDFVHKIRKVIIWTFELLSLVMEYSHGFTTVYRNKDFTFNRIKPNTEFWDISLANPLTNWSYQNLSSTWIWHPRSYWTNFIPSPGWAHF